MTDGQLHVRQCLFPEAQRSGVDLPSYYYHFHDLRKEVASIAPEARQVCPLMTPFFTKEVPQAFAKNQPKVQL